MRYTRKAFLTGGIALATALTSLTGNAVLMLLLVRKFGSAPFGFPSFFGMLARLSLACGAAGAGAYYAVRFVTLPWSTFTRPVLGGLIFGLLFIASCALLRIRELKPFLARFLRIKLK